MNIAQKILTTFYDDPNLLKKVITGDESWVDGYDIEIKDQSSQWKAFCYDFETEAVGDTRKRVLEVFRGLEKTLT